MKPDFSGYATKNDLKCSDGRTIRAGAFKHQHNTKVPLVWQHQHDNPDNILGYAMLEHREDGVYTHAFFNSSPAGLRAKIAVEHGDIESLSIYANKLREEHKNVLHGNIKEVSLVLSGANPGALIENVYIRHGDEEITVEGEVLIFTGEEIVLEHADEDSDDDTVEPKEFLESLNEEQQEVVNSLLHSALTNTESDLDDEAIQHAYESLDEEQKSIVNTMIEDALEHATTAEGAKTVANKTDEQTAKDIYDAMSEEEKNVVAYMVGQAIEEAGEDAEHSDKETKELIHSTIKEGLEEMSRNVFETHGKKADPENTLSHSDVETIFTAAKKNGSFKDAFLEHAGTYGIDDIDVLFPDAKNATSAPDVIGRRTEWVDSILSGSKHTPFARIKSTAVDLTADEARAKGYVKGNLKKEEVIRLLKRVTTPTTVYKKQKLDRDDIVDIVDLDVVSWLKAEMRVMLDEEVARAILIGDGREPDDDDKINEDHIRPIAHDDHMYAHQVTVPANVSADAIVETVLRARVHYKGTGTPTFYTTDQILTDLILLEDKIGRRKYETEQALAAALRVAKIVVVEVMESVPDLLGILVNIADYTVGADKGGQISMFDDFDIDYNQEKYLIETRLSGALTKPKSAVVLKRVSGTTVTPDAPSYNPETHTIAIPTLAGVEYYNVTSATGDGTLVSGNVVITETTEIEARPATGYSFPHNTDTDWTFAYVA